MTEQFSSASDLAAFFEETKKHCLAAGSPLLEANADALQFLVGTASRWPDFSEIPLVYQQALRRLISGNQSKFLKDSAHCEEILPEIVSAARLAQQAFAGLYAAVAKYGPHSMIALLSAVSIVMSIKDIYQGRKEEIAALRVAEDFVSSLDERFVRNSLHRVAVALLHFEA